MPEMQEEVWAEEAVLIQDPNRMGQYLQEKRKTLLLPVLEILGSIKDHHRYLSYLVKTTTVPLALHRLPIGEVVMIATTETFLVNYQSLRAMQQTLTNATQQWLAVTEPKTTYDESTN
jgi:hypothetical protein